MECSGTNSYGAACTTDARFCVTFGHRMRATNVGACGRHLVQILDRLKVDSDAVVERIG